MESGEYGDLYLVLEGNEWEPTKTRPFSDHRPNHINGRDPSIKPSTRFEANKCRQLSVLEPFYWWIFCTSSGSMKGGNGLV